MATMSEDPLRRLQILQRDLIAFTDSRLANLERLSTQLDASAKDLERLLVRNKKNEKSRTAVQPTTNPKPDTITIDDVQYRVRDAFRDAAITVADELDLDELEAAKLCIESQVDESGLDSVLALRAMVRFHEQRHALLDCMRLLLQLGIDSDSEDDSADAFREVVKNIIDSAEPKDQANRLGASAYWQRCVDGLSDIENFLKKIAQYRDKLVVTGQGASSDEEDALRAQRLLLTRQHEAMGAILAYLMRGAFVKPEDYRSFVGKAASLEADIDITIHYLPILISGAAHFAADQGNVSANVARDLHKLYAGQQWKQSDLKAAATVCWLAEYNARFSHGANELTQSEADRKREEEARSKLFFDSLKAKAFHFMLMTAAFLKPVLWYDPSRTGLVDFLVEGAVSNIVEAPRASEEFSAMTMREFQVFSDAFVTNMPDTLRQLKFDEDESRRNILSQSGTGSRPSELDLERFMVIMACAYQDDGEAARDFWSDKESNLYGFLRWISQRLPTPRVAAFCQLLRSIASDDKSADQAHRFLLEDVAMASGKLRKAYAVSWAQIFNELELYASNLKDRPSAPQTTDPGQEQSTPEEQSLVEPETGIMLDAYLGLAAHICRTSPDARNWLLKDQPFHLGEVMFQLARTAVEPRIRACCLDMLSALLTDKVLEVRNGMWVLLDSWIANGGLDGSSTSRPQGRVLYPAKQYLQVFSNNAEAGTALLRLLNALVAPFTNNPELPVDNLPFPENLGAPHRHAGIDVFVDFVMGSVFAQKVARMPMDGEITMVDLLRYECLHFIHQCLASFNEDLVFLANTANVAVESAMETKSLMSYVRLHPFARVMEWLFDKSVTSALFAAIQQNIDTLDNADPTSPVVRATLRALQVLNHAWKLQPAYIDIVRPIIMSQTTRSQSGIVPIAASLDEIFLTHLNAVVDIAQFTACKHVDVSLESIALLQKIGSSRKLAETTDGGTGNGRRSNRLLGLLTPMSTALTLGLQQDFILEEWDLEIPEVPLKLIRAKAILDLLHASLDASGGKPCLAHCLLGFDCSERSVDVLPQSAFASSSSLFHAIAARAADLLVTTGPSGFTSWLLNVRRGCLEVVLKLATSPLTSGIVHPELRAMDFLLALSRYQTPASASLYWDGKAALDPNTLLDSSATAICDFMHIRRAFFEFAAADLRLASEQGAFSIQERLISSLLGTIRLPSGEQLPTISIFELFDFSDLETVVAVEPNYAQCTYFADVDLSVCTKDDTAGFVTFDLKLAYELLALRKRDLREHSVLKDQADSDRAQDEIQAILASLASQNNWRAIQASRIAALEAWTELLSLVVTKGGLERNDAIALSLQGLLVVLPKFEKSLAENMDSAALLAKLTLIFANAIGVASRDSSQQTANVAIERLLTIFRVSLKVLTDSSTDLALRDVSYRTCCVVLASLPASPTNSSGSSLASAKQLSQMIQNAGERLLTIVTEDAFSGRGVTRVSALLFLDGLASLSQSLKVNAQLLRALTKLNFIPVLIDNSIGSVAAVFGTEDEMIATLAYYHTALALLLRLSQTSDGAQLVVNSGLFAAIDDSKLFSTDPDIGLDIDNPTALKEFYTILAGLLRVITAAVLSKGPQPGHAFLQLHRYTVQALFKQASRGQATEVAHELSRLILATDFLEDDEVAVGGALRGGFT